jgi:hypothetical protein
MSQGMPISVRQALVTTPPRVAAQIGQAGAVTVSATAGVLSLAAYSQQPEGGAGTAQTIGANSLQFGVTWSELSIYALTASLGIVFGPTIASVTGANAPAIATVGTLNGSGIYTPPASSIPVAWPIAAGTWQRFLIQGTQDLFMGFVASGAGTMYWYQSSMPNP